MTNYDYLTGLSPYDLANVIMCPREIAINSKDHEHCCKINVGKSGALIKDCIGCTRKWLDEPYEGITERMDCDKE